jgi:hypothetical protein
MGTVTVYICDILLTLLQLRVSSLEQFSPLIYLADFFPNFYSLTNFFLPWRNSPPLGQRLLIVNDS